MQNCDLQLQGFCDSDWASCLKSMCSITCYFMMLGNSPPFHGGQRSKDLFRDPQPLVIVIWFDLIVVYIVFSLAK